MSKFNKLFIGVILIQLVLLSIIILKYSSVLIFGKTYLIKTLPVDPRDIFRWDYVTLRYPISTYSWNISWVEKKYDRLIGSSVYIVPMLSWDREIVWIKELLFKKPQQDHIEWKVSSYNWMVDYKVSFDLSGVNYIQTYQWWDYYRSQFFTWDSVNVLVDTDWKIVSLYDNKFKETYADYSIVSWKILSVDSHYTYTFDFWADKYFVQEHSWKDIEKSINDWEVLASWKVLDGKVVLDDLIVK